MFFFLVKLEKNCYYNILVIQEVQKILEELQLYKYGVFVVRDFLELMNVCFLDWSYLGVIGIYIWCV